MGTAERRQREKEQRRNDIVDAAEKVFFSRGFRDAKVGEIADEAEVSKGTIYIYFGGKEDLYHAIVLRGVSLLSSMFEEAVRSRKSGIERIRAIGLAYIDFFREYPDYFNALIHYEGHRTNKFPDENPLRHVAGALESGIEDGTIRGDIDPVRMALLLWGQTTGVLQVASFKCEAVELEYGIPTSEILSYYMEQTHMMLRARDGE